MNQDTQDEWQHQADKANQDNSSGSQSETSSGIQPEVQAEVKPGIKPPARTSGLIKLIIAAFFCVATMVQFIVPIDFGPDEPFHMESAYDIAQGRLPRLHEPSGKENHIAQHPPAYYATMAVIWKLSGATREPLSIVRGIVSYGTFNEREVLARRLMRLCSALFGCVVLWFVARTLALLDIPPSWQVFLVAWAAAWPMLQYVCGVMNNESMAYAYSAWMCYLIVARWRIGSCTPREAFWLGLLCGAGALIKQNTLFVLPAALWVLVKISQNRPANIGAFFGGALLTGTWWPLHNILEVGEPFPTYTPNPTQPTLIMLIRDANTILKEWLRVLLETSFIPDWSWYFVKREFMTAIAVGGVAVLCTLFIMGLRRGKNTDNKLRELRSLSFSAMLLLLVGVMGYCMFKDQRAQIGGRYLLNALPWTVVFMAASLPLWSKRIDAATGETTIAPVGLLGLVLLGFMLLVGVTWWFLAWTYYDTMIALELERRAGGG